METVLFRRGPGGTLRGKGDERDPLPGDLHPGGDGGFRRELYVGHPGDHPAHPSLFQTKQFDFGSPERRKTIRRLHLGVSADAGTAVRLSYITDGGMQEDVYEWRLDDSAQVLERAVTPGISRSASFGIRGACQGVMGVSNLVIRYETGGEVK